MERMAGVRRLIALQSMFNFDAAQRMGYRFRPLHFHECNCVRVSARQGVSISFSCVYKLFFFLSVSSSRSLLVTTYLHSFSLPTLPLQLPLSLFSSLSRLLHVLSCAHQCQTELWYLFAFCARPVNRSLAVGWKRPDALSGRSPWYFATQTTWSIASMWNVCERERQSPR